jgi:hypothetical protein
LENSGNDHEMMEEIDGNMRTDHFPNSKTGEIHGNPNFVLVLRCS